jgi:diadenosine tetraphosphate (Ap4A) HIT family hydrolase
MNDSQKKLVDLDNARYDDQREIMQKIQEEGYCPFCIENYLKNNDAILEKGKYWYFVKNKWPYENTKQHFMFITNEHVEAFAELSPEASAELMNMAAKAIEKYKIPGGALALRFGDTDYSAGSVQHMHAQLIHPDVHKPGYSDKPVRLKIGKTTKKQSGNTFFG